MQAAGTAGVATAAAAAAAVLRDRKAWEKSSRIQFTHFKANHRLGKRAAEARKAAAKKATAAKRIDVLAKRQIRPAGAGSGAGGAAKTGAGKRGVKINSQMRS